ncbi:MAG: YicC/YloC family endoribonuclease [Clostridia bacterium]
MTGYGKSTKIIDGREMTIELKSVNHRFLDINTKLPKQLVCVEDVLRKAIQSRLSRGRIDVFISYQDKRDAEKSVTVDLGLAKGYYNAVKTLLGEFELENDFTVSSFLKIPDVIRPESFDEDLEVLTELVEQTTNGAIDELNKMRCAEGEKLKKDMLERIVVLEDMLKKIEEQAPKVAENYREKLTARVTEVLGNIEIDQNKLINEVAFYADKSNIDEEITRLKSHFVQARNIMNKETLVGRKMDFLIQEFNRETNTICSKSNDLTLTGVAVAMKSEIEKVREQVQNLE